MAPVTTSYKRMLLRYLLRFAQQEGETLCDVLNDAGQARIEETQKGKILVSVAGNGHSTSWQVPQDFTPQDAAGLVSELLDRYDEAVAKLAADGNSSPTDQQVATEVLDKLRPVRSVACDFSGLRVEPVEVEA